MAIFILILVSAVLLQVAAYAGLNSRKSFKVNAAYATGAAFILTGISHFVFPEKFMQMMPEFLPFPRLLIYLSGFLEIVGGLGLLINRTRKISASGLVILLLAVFPANIYVALNNIQLGGFMNYPFYQWVRLPMQFVLIGWILWCADINKFRSKNI